MKYKVFIVLLTVISMISCSNSPVSPPDTANGGGITMNFQPAEHDTLPAFSTVRARVYDQYGNGVEGVAVLFSSDDPVQFESAGNMVTTNSDGWAEDEVYIYGLLDGYCDVEIFADLADGNYNSGTILYTGIDCAAAVPGGDMSITWYNSSDEREGEITVGSPITLIVENIGNADASCSYDCVQWQYGGSGVPADDTSCSSTSWKKENVNYTVAGTYTVTAQVKFICTSGTSPRTVDVTRDITVAP